MKADPIVIGTRQFLIGLVVATMLGPASAGSSIAAAEQFRRLNATQIRAEVAGKELTDGVHWRDFYESNGTLTMQSMGRKKIGKWWIDKNELCVERGADGGGCYEVWISRTKIELRRLGLDAPVFEGMLQRPLRRE